MLTMYRNVFFGEVKDEWKDLPDTNRLEWLTLAPLAVLIVWLGVQPNSVLNKTEGAVTHIVGILNAAQQIGPEEMALADRNPSR